MRKWFKYITQKNKSDFKDHLEFTNYQLFKNDKFNKGKLDFNYFIQSELNQKLYNYLKNSLKNKKTISIGSGWGNLELFLSENCDIVASDINQLYVNFHKENTKLRYIFFNILSLADVEKFKNKFDQIIVPGIVYLFDNDNLNIFFSNLKKISKKNADIYLFFRSRDSFVMKIIDNIILPIDEYIALIYKKIIRKENNYLTKNFHGFRRTEKEFISIIKENNFLINSISYDMFEAEYNRSRIIKKLNISKIFSLIFFKSHPYLNFYHLKNL